MCSMHACYLGMCITWPMLVQGTYIGCVDRDPTRHITSAKALRTAAGEGTTVLSERVHPPPTHTHTHTHGPRRQACALQQAQPSAYVHEAACSQEKEEDEDPDPYSCHSARQKLPAMAVDGLRLGRSKHAAEVSLRCPYTHGSAIQGHGCRPDGCGVCVGFPLRGNCRHLLLSDSATQRLVKRYAPPIKRNCI